MGALSIVIVPAASAVPLIYEQVIDGVVANRFDIQALYIPSVGLVGNGVREGSPPTMYDDAAFIAGQVNDLADAGRDILLVMHSYGGTAGTQSAQGLSKIERQKQGKTGGIVGLAYMTCLVPELGKPASSRATTPPKDAKPLMAMGGDGWFYYPDASLVATRVFSDMPFEEGLKWGKELVKHSAASFGSPLTYAGYKDLPVSYLVCEDDLSITAETQRSQIDMIERESGNTVDVTSIQAGHVPPISAPQDVIKWILHVATKYAMP
ncbi:hypothetical protein BJ166DRAFT_565924 [Pestalotiopsis sp. NC0098]|nr:hypothetical protein BJ166DRAFT_565924 [Pestalotiopsis sp. NC0098]